MLHPLYTAMALGVTLAALRIYLILPRAKTIPPPPGRASSRSLAVFLGSGGHTSEALALLSGLDFHRYTPRTYYISDGDHLSARKAMDLEDFKGSVSSFSLRMVPRARRVHQHLLTVPLSAMRSFCACTYYMMVAPFTSRADVADVLILNGPGTCCVLGLAVYVNKFFGLRCPRIIYVESFARVEGLSLTGKILRPFTDRFIVQWPQILREGGRGECCGCLV
ncbi:glycosyltransferase family 1 protein [Schizophyllum amplum]|uniref:UDP-N-acetylglucosamine transferase subunit ALG14 n=1 Tax=Schizophyllum amplum TaxID=97359 RepID=A0A550CYR1_9AGAR|nr:glycosyltransferase family 1 protein [Auriculariopsis ampla]